MARVKGTRGSRTVTVSLKAVALGVALAGFFLPFAMQSPKSIAEDAGSMLAGAGESLSASVPLNPYNSLAEQLAAKEQSLNEREAELDVETRASNLPSTADMFGFVSFALSLFLLVLVGVNFYLDSRRGKHNSIISSKFSVDLR